MVAAARPTEYSVCVEYCSTCFRCISSFNVPESQMLVVLSPFTKGNTDTHRCCLSRLRPKWQSWGLCLCFSQSQESEFGASRQPSICLVRFCPAWLCWKSFGIIVVVASPWGSHYSCVTHWPPMGEYWGSAFQRLLITK